MKKQLPAFLTGVVVSALIFTAAPAIAAQIQTITATLNTVNIEVNGQKVATSGENYTLENGKQTAGSIVYNETTYVPIRKFGEIMGAEIGYDGATGSVTVKGEVKGASESTTLPDNTASTDYSDWSKEDEAAYQEFKGMWTVSFSRLDEAYNISHYKAEYIGSDEYVKTLRTFTEKRVEMLTMRLAEEYFNPSHQLMILFFDDSGAAGTCKIRIDDDGNLIKSPSSLQGLGE